MRKLVITLILAALGVGGYFGYQKIFVPPPEKPQVIQTTVSQGNILDVVKATGTLQPLRTSPVGSQVSGVVKRLYVDFNSIVKQGMLIAELDDSLLRTQVELQQANLERQQGDIGSQEVQLENDKANLARQEALFKKDLLNQQAIDTARLQVKTRTVQVESAKKQLLTVQAALSTAKLNLSYAKIYSPIDGVVVNRQVDEGQTVQSSVNVAQFFTLATDLRTLKLQAWVDEADIGKIRPEMQVQFQVDSYGNERFSGTVDAVRLNAQNTNNVVTYPVWIEVPNPQLKLRPSMTATLDIILSEATGVVRVPMTATRFRPNADIYAALGAPAPVSGQARALAQAGAPAAGREGAPAAAAGEQPLGRGGDQAAGGDAAGGRRTRGGGGGGRGGRGGAGFGQQQGGGANMTAEDRQRLAAQFGAAGGRGGRGRGPASNTTATPIALDNAKQIDELWAPVPRPSVNLNVWTWDEANKKLTQIPVQVGVSDGQFGELLAGNLKVGDRVVTAVVVPQTSQQRNQQNNSLFGGQQRRGGGAGGPQPGGGGGAPAGGGGRGGGGEGGGGGGGGRGGGGGGF